MILNSADYCLSSHIYLTFILQLPFALKNINTNASMHVKT